MTVSVRIVNTGNCDGDEVTVRTQGSKNPGEVLQRGQVSQRYGVSVSGHTLELTGKHGGGGPAGEVHVATAHVCPPGTIGWAIERMRDGARVRRRGWNGKGMYILLVDPNTDAWEQLEGWEPFILMHTATGANQPGWLASQADLLADDWEEVE